MTKELDEAKSRAIMCDPIQRNAVLEFFLERDKISSLKTK